MTNNLVQNRIGVIGATSLTGTCLLPMLTQAGWQVTAFSRQIIKPFNEGVEWQQLPLSKHYFKKSSSPRNPDVIPFWICLAPVWVLPDYFDLLNLQGVQRLVVLSSTSRFTKDNSTDPKEQAVAQRLTNAETRVQNWAESHGIEWIILRPTLIYGLGQDKNISEIARFIYRFGFFPLLGQANGLRQPIYVGDVARACLAAVQTPGCANHAYNISGGEIISYRDMVVRVFNTLSCRPRLLTIPLWAFRLALTFLRCLPRYRQWSTAMAERMNQDMVFDHTEALRDLNFKPKAFILAKEDLPL